MRDTDLLASYHDWNHIERAIRSVMRRLNKLSLQDQAITAVYDLRDSGEAAFGMVWRGATCPDWDRLSQVRGGTQSNSERETTKAVLCESFGPAENLTLADIEAPQLIPGHVIVEIRACALNFPDVLMIEGKYQSLPPFPFTPGGEFAGVVSELLMTFKTGTGDEVFGARGHGAMAEQISSIRQILRAKPQSMGFAQASGISTTYGTSYYALKQRANLQTGETLLVLGAAAGRAGGGRARQSHGGARYCRSFKPRKLQIAQQAGADNLIDYSDGELKKSTLTEGKGADVIYDPVGGPMFDQWRCINWADACSLWVLLAATFGRFR